MQWLKTGWYLLSAFRKATPVALLQGEDFKGDRAANLAKYLC